MCAGLGFAALAVLAHTNPYFPIDLSITRYVQSHDTVWLDPFLGALNTLGFPPTVDIVYGLVLAFLFFSGHRWEAAGSLFSAGGASGLSWLTKFAVARPRPSPDLVHVQHLVPNPTFPAGHVAGLTAFAGFLCYLAIVRLAPTWRRAFVIAFLSVEIVLMGLARIQSGEHWPSDVLGGYLLGFAWLCAAVICYEAKTRERS